ncbi:SDR family oxidoreductase [Salinicola tamaricis]|uniref:SDR family oxidoreductase n=1 Tax=Salinicola tamaricis TaxID=1771309 RepID=UPI002413D934|nr:SDR family NAD(P)-dependent oxidoreductase [Salinicola tamaricis]
MDLELQQQHILITGATSGIGLAIARRLAQLGAELTLCGRDRARCEALEHELGARTLVLDITDELAVKDAFSDLAPLDGLVNCAGISLLDAAIQVRAADLDAMLATNVRAAAIVAREAANNMLPPDARAVSSMSPARPRWSRWSTISATAPRRQRWTPRRGSCVSNWGHTVFGSIASTPR